MIHTQLRLRSIVKGVGAQFPVVDRLFNSAAGHAVGARYFYSVWLRHISIVARRVPEARIEVVGELGPGDALGLGLCALLSGAQRYIGLDRLPFALQADNLRLLDELIDLFAQRAPIPGPDEFPGVYPLLSDYSFPRSLLNDERLAVALAPERIDRIRAELQGKLDTSPERMLGYAAPWDEANNVREHCVDLLVSQAVLEHVDDVASAYTMMRRWLKADGVMSHRIDYTCHGITRDWYGHWLVSPAGWRLVRGRRAYLINRLPHSRQIDAIRSAGFEIVATELTTTSDRAPADRMCVAYDDADLGVKGAFIVARPHPGS